MNTSELGPGARIHSLTLVFVKAASGPVQTHKQKLFLDETTPSCVPLSCSITFDSHFVSSSSLYADSFAAWLGAWTVVCW